MVFTSRLRDPYHLFLRLLCLSLSLCLSLGLCLRFSSSLGLSLRLCFGFSLGLSSYRSFVFYGECQSITFYIAIFNPHIKSTWCIG